ncbi:transient receptor potential-gamma protein [Eurytemora carolleeae]|uniref:transient receptor potential-gamma protein n=1 Tax=Eurytemora carolleeae TaxID=1294199 RepID=UPI000C75E9DE|nr:transient receptor potential-gamma protein [Eurytemora carolleeae]|eukprot:XP_023347420.1 transient receptor potential-gamma protein-like [Eurytemora affinis]
MVNTYHRIFREADVQWKFFRACIWWKYLDNNSILPPPFTIIFLMHAGSRKLHSLYQHQGEPRSVHEEDLSACKREFIKKYKRLILTLIQTSNSSWGFEKRSRLVLSNMLDASAD